MHPKVANVLVSHTTAILLCSELEVTFDQEGWGSSIMCPKFSFHSLFGQVKGPKLVYFS